MHSCRGAASKPVSGFGRTQRQEHDDERREAHHAHLAAHDQRHDLLLLVLGQLDRPPGRLGSRVGRGSSARRRRAAARRRRRSQAAAANTGRRDFRSRSVLPRRANRSRPRTRLPPPVRLAAAPRSRGCFRGDTSAKRQATPARRSARPARWLPTRPLWSSSALDELPPDRTADHAQPRPDVHSTTNLDIPLDRDRTSRRGTSSRQSSLCNSLSQAVI